MRLKLFLGITACLIMPYYPIKSSDELNARLPIGLSATIYGSIGTYKSLRTAKNAAKKNYKEVLKKSKNKQIKLSLSMRKEFKMMAHLIGKANKIEALLSAIIALIGTGIACT